MRTSRDKTTYFKTNKFIFFILFFITVLALFMRVKYVEQTEVCNLCKSNFDAVQYVTYGYNIYSHKIFSKELSEKPNPDSYRSPGYPLFVSLAFAIGGTKNFYFIIIYSQAILSAMSVILAFFIGTYFLSKINALLAAALVSASPHLVSMTGCLLTETLFSFTILSAICLFCMALEKKHILFFIISGMLFGFAYLVNETAFFLPFLLAAAITYFHEKNISRAVIKNMFIYLIVFLLFPAVWIWRNHNLSSESAQGSSRAIGTMSHGAYPDFIYKNKKFQYFPYREDPMQPLFGSTFGNFSKILFERFKERPFRYLSWYLFEKPYYLWSWNILQGQGDVYVYPVKYSLYKTSKMANLSRIFMKILHPFVLIAALTGIIIFLHKKTTKEYIFLPFTVIIYYTILYTVFAPWPRYSVPLRPELYLFAVWTCSVLIKMFKNKNDNDKHAFSVSCGSPGGN